MERYKIAGLDLKYVIQILEKVRICMPEIYVQGCQNDMELINYIENSDSSGHIAVSHRREGDLLIIIPESI